MNSYKSVRSIGLRLLEFYDLKPHNFCNRIITSITSVNLITLITCITYITIITILVG